MFRLPSFFPASQLLLIVSDANTKFADRKIVVWICHHLLLIYHTLRRYQISSVPNSPSPYPQLRNILPSSYYPLISRNIFIFPFRDFVSAQSEAQYPHGMHNKKLKPQYIYSDSQGPQSTWHLEETFTKTFHFIHTEGLVRVPFLSRAREGNYFYGRWRSTWGSPKNGLTDSLTTYLL